MNSTSSASIGDAKSINRSAIVSLALLTRQKSLGISVGELSTAFSGLRDIGEKEVARVVADFDLKSKWVSAEPRQLYKLPLPALGLLQNGEFAVLVQANEESVLVQTHTSNRAQEMSLEEFSSMSSNRILLVTASEDKESESNNEFGFKWFFKTVFKYRSIMRETLLASFFIQLFALVTPLFFMIVIDKVFAHNNMATLDVLVFAMVVVAVFDVLLSGIRTYLMSHTTNRVDLELGSRLFKHMMRLPLSYYESRRTGETIARMREVETIRNFLTGSTLTLIIDLLFLVVFLLVMFLFSTKMFLIVLVALPLFFLASFFITPMLRSKLEDKHQKMAENQSFLVETLAGIETVKSASVENHHQREYEDKLAGLSRSGFYSSNLTNLINQFTSLVSKSLTIILLYVGANLVVAGELSVGQLIAFNMLTARVVQPIQRLAQIWQEFTGMKVSVKRVADIMRSPTEPVLLKGRTSMPKLKGAIKVEGLSFSYAADSPEILSDVNLNIAAGEIVGIVGSTGSGKTTLAKLLQRLYVPSKGRISIDDMNLVGVDGAQLRSQIGVVAQDFVLFNKTIRDNISLGDTNVSDDDIVAVAQKVGVHNTIMQLPEGYDTVLQERGRGLSMGQRQAIALARALVRNPSVLILDEATSAMDYEAEQNFQANFKAMAEGRTTIVIAHRLSTVRDADRIITLEGGSIVENDTPDNLLSSGGRFATLFNIHQSTWNDPTAKEPADAK